MAEKTIEIYQTKGFKHEGVTGSEPVTRLDENGAKGITTQVMKENNLPIKKIVKDETKNIAVGKGM